MKCFAQNSKIEQKTSKRKGKPFSQAPSDVAKRKKEKKGASKRLVFGLVGPPAVLPIGIRRTSC